MARGKVHSGSKSAWFREYYHANPHRVREKNNDDTLKAWQDAHAGEALDQSIKQAMANVKSDMKKKLHLRKKPGRKPGSGLTAVASGTTSAAPRLRGGDLEELELAIDRCLTRARLLEEREEGIHDVARHLRLARNTLILLGR